MTDQTMLHADLHVDRYKADPLEAAATLAKIWCNNQTDCVDLWGCDWASTEFVEAFLDHCREAGFLKEALGIWWCVHNCPGPETEPCFHDDVCQCVIDYSKKYGMESKTEKFKEYGMDKFKLLEQVMEKDYSTLERLAWGWSSKLAYIYPNPKDADGRFIPMIDSKDGIIPWPRHSDGEFFMEEELENQ